MFPVVIAIKRGFKTPKIIQINFLKTFKGKTYFFSVFKKKKMEMEVLKSFI